MKKFKLIFSHELNQLFEAIDGFPDFKDFLQSAYGQNPPSSVMKSKSNVLCDKSIINYRSELQNDEYGTIAHHCVKCHGSAEFIYSWEALINAIAKLTFVKVKRAVPWGSNVNNNEFFVINRKKLKKWFITNHNRFLVSRKHRGKLRLKQLSDSLPYIPNFEYQL